MTPDRWHLSQTHRLLLPLQPLTCHTPGPDMPRATSSFPLPEWYIEVKDEDKLVLQVLALNLQVQDAFAIVVAHCATHWSSLDLVFLDICKIQTPRI